jgi:hypothetical protein
MSQENIAKVIERASTDATFRSQLQKNPEAALATYELTAEEKAALMSGDTSKLSELGVDARATKFDGSSSIWDNSNTPFASGD